jgi:hypothetical protein
MEEECLFCGGPVACWGVVGWCVGRLRLLWCAGEVMERGGDVGVEVGGEVNGVCVGVNVLFSVGYHLEFSFER